MKIVAGLHRGRTLAAPKGLTARPTAARAREALFSILSSKGMFDDDGLDVLDCFAGTGALGLEALSRGAERAVFIEQDPASLAALAANIETLGEDDRVHVIRADARRPPKAPHPCHLIFLDPPYGKDLVAPTLTALAANGWLAENAVAVAEVGAEENPTPPQGFTLTDSRTYGAAKFLILEFTGIARY